MAINIKPNQALAFGPEGPANLPCNCSGSYCQPVESNDTFYIQGTIDEATGVNLSKFSLWTYQRLLGSGWILRSNKIYSLANNLFTATSNPLNLQHNVFYTIYADITTLTGTSTQYYPATLTFSGNHVNIPGDVTSAYPGGIKICFANTAFNNKTYTVVSSVYFSGTPGFTRVNVAETVSPETPTEVWCMLNAAYAPVAGQGYKIKVNNQYLELPDSTTQTSSGAYLLRYNYMLDGALTHDALVLECTNSNMMVIVNAIEVKQISRVGVAAVQGQTVLGSNPNPPFVSYYAAPDTHADNSEGNATLPYTPILFNALLNFNVYLAYTGCMQVCLYDSGFNNNQLQNPDFDTDLSYWTAGAHWSWGAAGLAICAPGLPPDVAGKLSQKVTVPGGCFYELLFTTGGLNIGNKMRIEYSINGGLPVNAGLYPNGANSARLDVTGYTNTVQLEVFFTPASLIDSFTINDTSLAAASPAHTCLSNCINVQPHHDCTLLFLATNNDNAFGFDYTTGFEHSLRVKAKMDVTAYPEETETPYIFSNNNRVIMFARRDKEFSIFLTDAPVHIHDCLSHMRLHDNFEIGTTRALDTTLYVKESAYEINRRKTSSLKQATFTVRERQGIAANFPCR